MRCSPCPNYQIQVPVHSCRFACSAPLHQFGRVSTALPEPVRQMPNALDNILLSAVIRRNIQRQTGIIFRQALLLFTNPFLQT